MNQNCKLKSIKVEKGKIMKYYQIKDKKITAISALRHGKTAPQIVVVAPSGSGKSTLIYLLLNHRLIPFMKIGIGEKSQTTIIPCEFVFDARIKEEGSFAIKIVKKKYASKEIHMTVLSVLVDLFGKNDCDTEETMDAFDEKFEQIIEPEEAMYHLGQIRDELPMEELKESLVKILVYMVDNDFRTKVRKRRDELKSKKVKLAEVRELIFEEMFEEMPEEIKEDYIRWLDNIGIIIERRLRDSIGDELFSENMIQYSLDVGDDGKKILSVLFDPKAPYSLLIDHISVASLPRKELIKMAEEKYNDLPFRFCIRDTMGITQKGIGAKDLSDSLEIALNCKADTILFLMSLEERDDILTECCKALKEKREELKKKSNLDLSVYLLFTKADRIVENLINKRNKGDLYITQATYDNNIDAVIEDIKAMMDRFSDMIPKEEVGWLSMRYFKDSYIVKALKEESLRRNFEPEGLFEKIVDFSMKTLKSTLPKEVKDPIFVTALDPDMPAVQVSVNSMRISTIIDQMQYALSKEPSTVNGYVITNKTPRLHGRSVYCYWVNLTLGLGHTTRASVYGNFSINMKGLLKRMLTAYIGSFKTLHDNCAVTFTADNLSDNDLITAVESLTNNDNIEAGMNPALGDRNIALQRLYEFYVDYFMNPSRFALVVDRVAYDMSYGNPELERKLNNIYYGVSGYDEAMRKLQYSFLAFFGSDDFRRILIEELDSVMTEMINKAIVVM